MSFLLALHQAAIFASVTLVYIAAARLGLSLAYIHPSATAVWPPTGIAIAALLLSRQRLWPAIFIGSFLSNCMIGSPAWASALISSGNVLEAVMGAGLMRRWAGGARAFSRLKSVCVFAAICGASAAVSASVGVGTLAYVGLSQNSYAAAWITWWLGNCSGALIIAPLIILWAKRGMPRLSGKQSLELAALLGVVGLRVDPVHLRRMLKNLIDNAIKFNRPRGRVEVNVRVEASLVRIEIKDSGIGIMPEALPGLFSRFHRAERSRNGQGAGLGLYIVRRLAEINGGRAWAESSGEGSNFFIELLAAESEPLEFELASSSV